MRKALGLLIVAALATAAPAGAEPVAKGLRLAVQDAAAGPDLDAHLARVVSEALLSEIRKLEGVSAIGRAEIREMLSFERERQLLGCDDEGCLAEIGGALGVDDLVTLAINQVGSSRQLVVRRLDIRKGRARGTVTKVVEAGKGEELLSLVGPAVEELFPERPLRPGRQRGVAPEVARKLDPPPLPRWLFFTTAGLATVAGGAATFLGLSFHEAQADYDALAGRSVTQPVSARDLDERGARAEDRAAAATTALIVTGGLVLAAGVEALLTDWDGAGDGPEPEGTARPVARLQVGPNAVAVSF